MINNSQINKSNNILENDLDFVEVIKKDTDNGHNTDNDRNNMDEENQKKNVLKSVGCQKIKPKQIKTSENSQSFENLKANYEASIGKFAEQI